MGCKSLTAFSSKVRAVGDVLDKAGSMFKKRCPIEASEVLDDLIADFTRGDIGSCHCEIIFKAVSY